MKTGWGSVFTTESSVWHHAWHGANANQYLWDELVSFDWMRANCAQQGVPQKMEASFIRNKFWKLHKQHALFIIPYNHQCTEGLRKS